MSYRIVSRLVGLLLLTAAGLKLFGLSFDPVARSGWLSTPWFQLLLIQFEGLLGLWLLSGWQQSGSWCVTSLTFATFTAFSLFAALVGQASCGCFGKVPVSPWYALAVDIGVLIAITLDRPAWNDLVPTLPAARRAAVKAAGLFVAEVIIVSGALALGAYAVFGSPAAALAHLRGEEVSVSPDFVDVGSGDAGELKSARVEITNRGGRSVRIIGGTSDCSCRDCFKTRFWHENS